MAISGGFKRAKKNFIVVTGVEANAGLNPPKYKDHAFYVQTTRGEIQEGEYATEAEAQAAADLMNNPTLRYE